MKKILYILIALFIYYVLIYKKYEHFQTTSTPSGTLVLLDSGSLDPDFGWKDGSYANTISYKDDGTTQNWGWANNGCRIGSDSKNGYYNTATSGQSYIAKCFYKVLFNKILSQKPDFITLNLTKIDVGTGDGGESNVRYDLSTQDITTTGFTLVIAKWWKTYFNGMRIQWYAYKIAS